MAGSTRHCSSHRSVAAPSSRRSNRPSSRPPSVSALTRLPACALPDSLVPGGTAPRSWGSNKEERRMETATVEPGPVAGVASSTVADLLPLAVREHGDRRAIMYKEEAAAEWTSKSYREVGEIAQSLALGLIDLGIEKGEKGSILANTRPEWSYYDFAALTAGAIVVPIYQTNSPEECQYVLENADATVVIVEDSEKLDKILQVRDRCPKLEHVIRMTGSSDDAISADDLTKRGASHEASEWEERWRSVTPDDICTFIYTSGTTGPPKGCVLSHGNYRAM